MLSFLDPSLVTSYVVLAAVLALSPGPDVFFVIANSLQRGPVGGWASAAGIGAGSILHALAAAIGVSAAIAASPFLFSIIQMAGAAYLLYLGIMALVRLTKNRGNASIGFDVEPLAPMEMFKRGLILNVLNPKVIIFYLALLPQFVNVELGQVGLQIFTLGTIHNVIGMVFLFTIAAMSGWSADWVRKTRLGVWLDGIAAVFFIGLAVRLMTAKI